MKWMVFFNVLFFFSIYVLVFGIVIYDFDLEFSWVCCDNYLVYGIWIILYFKWYFK